MCENTEDVDVDEREEEACVKVEEEDDEDKRLELYCSISWSVSVRVLSRMRSSMLRESVWERPRTERRSATEADWHATVLWMASQISEHVSCRARTTCGDGSG